MGAKPRPQGFGRDFRLRKRRDFTSFRDGRSRRYVLRHFILLLKPREAQPARLGITVGRIYGGATQRNRLKRRIREFFRKNKDFFSGLDVQFIAKAMRKEIPKEKYEEELAGDFEMAKKKAADFT